MDSRASAATRSPVSHHNAFLVIHEGWVLPKNMILICRALFFYRYPEGFRQMVRWLRCEFELSVTGSWPSLD